MGEIFICYDERIQNNAKISVRKSEEQIVILGLGVHGNTALILTLKKRCEQ
jgi:hypothetical protein